MGRISSLWVRGVSFVLTVASGMLFAEAAMAMTDKRAVAGAQSIAPAIPEPGAILLFAAGAAIVGWSVRRRRAEG